MGLFLHAGVNWHQRTMNQNHRQELKKKAQNRVTPASAGLEPHTGFGGSGVTRILRIITAKLNTSPVHFCLKI